MIKEILITIATFLLIIILCWGFIVLVVNYGSINNCRLLAEEGHKTELKYFGLGFKDCYVEGVPYDRYIFGEIK